MLLTRLRDVGSADEYGLTSLPFGPFLLPISYVAIWSPYRP